MSSKRRLEKIEAKKKLDKKKQQEDKLYRTAMTDMKGNVANYLLRIGRVAVAAAEISDDAIDRVLANAKTVTERQAILLGLVLVLETDDKYKEKAVRDNYSLEKIAEDLDFYNKHIKQ